MRLIFVIGAIFVAVVLAAPAIDTSYAHGGSSLIEFYDPSTGLTRHCAEQNAHYSIGRYVTYFEAASDHLHVGAKSGVSGLSVRRLTQNPFPYAGYYYDYFGEHYNDYHEGYHYIPDGYTGFKIEYNTTKVAGAIVVICYEVIPDDRFRYQAGMYPPLRISGPSGAGSTGPPQGQSGGGGGQGSVNEPPTLTGDTAIQYAEHTSGPVATYTATDPEDAHISWSLSGTDAADFSIIQGDLTFNAGPDYEDPTDSNKDNVYHVTVEASDGTNIVTLDVTVTVTNVNEPPEFPHSDTTRSVAENTAAGENIGAPVEATDPEGDRLTYALGGTDASSFDIATSSGQLLTKAALDPDTKSSYSVSVSVTDGKAEDGSSNTVVDGTIDVTINVVDTDPPDGGVGAGSRPTTLLKSIPRQLVPINGGSKTILLSDYFSDADEGYPPYDATISDTTIAAVEVSEGYLTITPKSIGVATTTMNITDTPSIREVFKTIVYRPVVPRTNTETVHIIDPAVETTLTSSDGSLSVTFPAGARDQFFQAAIDALSNDCGRQSPVEERRLCVLVDLFDLAAESVEESLDVAAMLSVTLDQQQNDAVQADLTNGDFTMWKGHGSTDTSWDRIPQCEEPRGQSECFSLVQTSNGGEITVFNIAAFSQFDMGLLASSPTPPPITPPPPVTPPDSGGSGDTSRSDDSDYSSGPTLRILGPVRLEYPENNADEVARYTIDDTDVEEVIWSVYGDRKSFVISSDGVLSFMSPPDYEDPNGIRGNTYWALIRAEEKGSPRRNDVLNVYVTVTQVNEFGEISGDVELAVPETHAGVIAQYEVDDPERGVITWTLSGPDALGFDIDSRGSLTSAGVLDFEAPSSSDQSNVHVLTITATDDGEPELSAQVDVTLTVYNINEAPQVSVIPDIDLTTERMPWMLDLDEYFTDPEGDSLSYEISGPASMEAAHAAIDGSTLSITPAGEGTASFYVVAADPGGLSAVGEVTVSIIDPTPAPTPVPSKVTTPVESATPAPATADDATEQSGPPAPSTDAHEPAVVTELSPAQVPLRQLSERRYRNLEQRPDSESQVVVLFAIEPVSEPMVPSMPVPARSDSDDEPATVTDVVAAPQGQDALLVEADESGGLSVWLIIPLALTAVLLVGYFIYMLVMHRVSQSLRAGMSGLIRRWPGT